MRLARWALAIAVATAAWVSVPRPAGAYIEEMYTLKKLIDECTHIYTAKVTAVDKVKRRISIKLIDPIKGKTNVKKVNFNLGQPQYEWQAAFACSDLTEGQQAILFWKEDGPGDMKSLLFANGYFQQNVGGYDVNNLDNIWIPFTHIEIRMNRTFCGTTVQLLALVRAHLQENKPLPAPKATVPEWTKERMQAKKKEEKVDFEDPAAVKKAVEMLAAAQGAAPKPQLGTGTGLKGEYFDNPDFTDPKASRVDAEVKFEWNGGEAVPGVVAETFSARWTGQVQAKFSETCTFYTNSDDGVRLWVNGKKLIDNWTDHAPTVDSGTIDLKAGEKVDIKLEFFQGGGPCCIILMWSSESQEQEVVPRTQLYPPAAGGEAKPSPATGGKPATGALAPATVPGGGTGLRGEYFNNPDFTSPRVARVDPSIRFEWGPAAPAPGVDPGTFSVRWTGRVEPLFSETYTFVTTSDGGIRLWVAGRLLIDSWKDHPVQEDAGTIDLKAGESVDVTLELYHNEGDARVSLAWFSRSQAREIVPASRLYPPAVVPAEKA